MRSPGARFSQYENQILLYEITGINAVRMFREHNILASEIYILDESGLRCVNYQKKLSKC